MAGDLDIHPASLRGAGKRLQDAADRLDDLWRQHVTTGDGRGDIFGADPIGGLIGASYHAALDIADTSYTSVTVDLRGFADVLNGIADDVEQTDQSSAADIAGSTLEDPA
ncbi:hypothetical protein ACTI_75230 [Actinoplanes sp. OR16]|uniref:type VII secretion target n=1 Tax=Actinoplanes sp. OR16 TaxID=946334 RepID=UPI000F6CC2F5|nr:type VII secretion target [Actinoplanes sp. OR16]BBH70838.1 hypothetical protein ACTI_75230 [Actinoplanes sp. OR16]